MKHRVIIHIEFLVLMSLCGILLLCVSCAQKHVITVSSQEPDSKLALVPMESLDAEGKKLNNPAKLDLNALKGSALRISAMGKATHYWFVPSTLSEKINVKVTHLPSCEATKTNRNRPLRSLLKSYQALVAKDYSLARGLATNASKIDPTLAAPHIVIGISHLREGDKARAASSFHRAKSLDPEDSEINVLLRAAQ